MKARASNSPGAAAEVAAAADRNAALLLPPCLGRGLSLSLSSDRPLGRRPSGAIARDLVDQAALFGREWQECRTAVPAEQRLTLTPSPPSLPA